MDSDAESSSSSSSEGDYRNTVATRLTPRPPYAEQQLGDDPGPSTSTGVVGMPPNPKGNVAVLPPPVPPHTVNHFARDRAVQVLEVLQRHYKSEKERLDSFAGFPSGTVDIRQLAAAGFWYTKSEDIVRCAFCNVEVGRWEEGDDPMQEHAKWSKNCRFLRHMDVGNIPVDPSNPPPLPPLEPGGFDECGIYNIKKSENCPAIPSLEKLGIQKKYTPVHPEYATLESRLESFSSWPIGLKQRPAVLADAGFFYTGLGDRTVCFQCGGGLKDWADNDDPWREHALYFSKCGYIVQTKGRDFIAEVLGTRPPTLTSEEIRALAIPHEYSIVPHTPPSPNSSSEPSSSSADPSSATDSEKPGNGAAGKQRPAGSSSPSKRIDDGRACKICYSEEIGVAFLPCGHCVSCVKCVSSLSTCAVCRKPFSATVRVFMS